LYQRERTGKGRVVEVAMQDASYASMASNLGMLHARGAEAPSRTGNRHGGLGISPYNVYKTTDGYVVINAPGDQHFRSILDVMGRQDLKDDPRFTTRSARVVNMLAVDELLEAWTSEHPKEDVAAKLLAAAVPCAPVRELSEVILDRNMHERGSLQWFDHPELGRVVLPHSPLRFEGTPLLPLQASVALGTDNQHVFGDWLGHTDEELRELTRDGVI
jgi:CoA:oxalate CoA-transferase